MLWVQNGNSTEIEKSKVFSIETPQIVDCSGVF